MTGGLPILYTRVGCADSPRVREWLIRRGVTFVEHDVTRDESAIQALLATGIPATPLVIIGAERIVGFQPGRMVAALTRREAGQADAGPSRSEDHQRE